MFAGLTGRITDMQVGHCSKKTIGRVNLQFTGKCKSRLNLSTLIPQSIISQPTVSTKQHTNHNYVSMVSLSGRRSQIRGRFPNELNIA
jgi:hypothetical protein